MSGHRTARTSGPDGRDADDLQTTRAVEAAAVMTGPDAPHAHQILKQRPHDQVPSPANRHYKSPTPAATATIDLTGYAHINTLAGLLSQDTAATDFNRDLDRLLTELANLRRP